MTRIYNPYDDQLKCNFCTQWFSCNLHFANLQRYSLNSCKKCLENFRFTLVDANTYKIYRLLLFDTGLTLPKAQNINITNSSAKISPQSKEYLARIVSELSNVQEDIKSKVSEYFQQEIKKAMKEVEKAQLIIESECLKIRKSFSAIQRQELNENILQKQLNKKMSGLKEIPLEGWINEPLSVLKQKKENTLYKSFSKNIQSSASNAKENINQMNKSNCVRSIKSRILGFVPLPQKTRNVSRQSNKQSITIARQRSQSRSMVKSRKLISSRKLQQQSHSLHVSNYHQLQRAEIIRLLNQKYNHQSYMREEVLKEESVIKKQDSQRNMVEEILQMKTKSIRTPQLLQLIGGNAQKVNFDCFLRSLGNMDQVKTIRIIKSHLVDADFDYLLRFIAEHPKVQTLIVTNNKLTELSIQALQVFKQRHPYSCLSQAYFGNNFIKSNHTINACQQLIRKGLEVFI